MFPRDSRNTQLTMVIVGLVVALLVAGIVAFMVVSPSDSSAAAAAGAAASDDSGFPFWIFIVIFPAVITPLIAVKMNRQADEKEKTKPLDPVTEKPKRDDVHYTIGADGELVEVIDDEDQYEVGQGR